MTTALPLLRALQFRYTLIQMLFWAAYAALGSFQTALLLERGFSSGEAGDLPRFAVWQGSWCPPLAAGQIGTREFL